MAFTEFLAYAPLILFCSVAYYFLSSFRAYWRLRQFPGPLLASWSDWWYIRAAVSGRCHEYLSDVNTKYGPLARIGPNTLLTSDEEFYRRINTPRSGYRKGEFYKAFRFGAEVENVFSETDNERHTYLRKRVTGGYSGRDNPNIEADIDAVLSSLIKSWKERYVSYGSNNKEMDLARQMQYLTLDIITALLFSKPFGWVTTDSDMYEYADTMAANMPVIFFTSAVPILSRILRVQRIQRLISPSVKDRVGMGKIKAVSSDIIAQRFLEARNHPEKITKGDMTTSFIANKLTETEIADNALLAILAGSDTSATVLRAGFLHILIQPRIVRTLQAECDEAGVARDEIISYSRALELPYLQACVKESLRFYPAGAGLNPRVVPPNGDYFNGQFIPGGTVIAQCAWNLHRLKHSAYGPDAHIYRPERWTEAMADAKAGSREQMEKMDKALDLVFGYGEFMCLGYRIARVELAKVMFELIRRFDIGIVNGLQPMERNTNHGLFVQEGMWVRVEER